jgi:hypothetical protein
MRDEMSQISEPSAPAGAYAEEIFICRSLLLAWMVMNAESAMLSLTKVCGVLPSRHSTQRISSCAANINPDAEARRCPLGTR